MSDDLEYCEDYDDDDEYPDESWPPIDDKPTTIEIRRRLPLPMVGEL